MAIHGRPPMRRARRRSIRRRGGALARAGTTVGVWRRRWWARLPTAPILLALAGAVAVASLRAGPGDLGLDPATASPVVVATGRLDAGTVIGTEDIELRDLPAAARPDAIIERVEDALGRQVTAPILAGEPVAAGRLAPDGLVGVAAATPSGRSSFAIPVDDHQPPVEVDQRVDLYAFDPSSSFDPSTALDPSDPLVGWDDVEDASGSAPGTDGRTPPTTAGTTGARRIARAAVVVATDDRRITVAVGPDEAAIVAASLIDATVVVAVVGPQVDP